MAASDGAALMTRPAPCRSQAGLASVAGGAALGLRYRARARVVTIRRPSPAVDWLARRTGLHPSLTTPEPQAHLVVDGFQGSGNSNFFVRFVAAQVPGHHLVGHAHSPVKLRAAITRGLPTVIIIRPPADAVVSMVSRWPYISVGVALRNYHRFYSYLMPIRYDALVAEFADIINNLQDVVEALNDKFGTSFCCPPSGDTKPVSTIERSARKEELRHELTTSSRYLYALKACDDLYSEFRS